MRENAEEYIKMMLEFLDESLNRTENLKYPRKVNRSFWEGYRRALVELLGENSKDYPFIWETNEYKKKNS